MSDKDKTGDKLVASIRKTRAGATKKAAARKTSGTAADSTPRKQAAPKPAATKSRPAAKTAKASVPSGTADPFQYGRRVWPD